MLLIVSVFSGNAFSLETTFCMHPTGGADELTGVGTFQSKRDGTQFAPRMQRIFINDLHTLAGEQKSFCWMMVYL